MHLSFMKAALEQAWLGRGHCAPNPSVGAVVVYDNEIIAADWHKGVGTPHAEQLVLAKVPPGLKGMKLYVTLEPCNHWGKTPPCVLEIIKRQVAEVIYGFSDPNPLVSANNTPKILQEQGVSVQHYPIAEIDAFYESYFYWTKTKKPWVTVKLAQSLDAKISDESGKPVQITNALCTTFTHEQRLHTDIILTTAKTIQKDDPQLNSRLNDNVVHKPLAILDKQLSLDASKKVFQSPRLCHIYHSEKVILPPRTDSSNESLNDSPATALPVRALDLDQKKQQNSMLLGCATCHYYPISFDQNHLDLKSILNHLGKMGYHDVWVEAGATLFAKLHQEKLVHRTFIYIAPKVLGEGAISAFQGNLLFERHKSVSWQIKADNVIACLNWANEHDL